MKRFPSEMATHVTRQGIRDHIGHSYHTEGKGCYSNEFIKIINSGKLKSAIGILLSNNEKDKAIANFLKLDECTNEKEGLDRLNEWVDFSNKDSSQYADRTSVHLATKEVADRYYGAESGNEIFFAYPSQYIASQYLFTGDLSDGNGGYWNDQWIYTNEKNGIDINAGLVFIPKNCPVDAETGSRYLFDKDKNPIENKVFKEKIRDFFEWEQFNSFCEEFLSLYNEKEHPLTPDKISLKDNLLINRKITPNTKTAFFIEKIKPFKEILEEKLNIKDKKLLYTLLNYESITSLKNKKEYGEQYEGQLNDEIDNILMKNSIFYKESENTISSQEYWEKYFEKNKEKKPSKIIYYEGTDPTSELLQWCEENNINKKTENNDFYFPEHNISPQDPLVNDTKEKFQILAKKIIKDFFKNKKPKK